MATGTTTGAGELVRREIDEVWNGNDLDALDGIYAEAVTVGTVRSGSDRPLVDREDVKALHREWDEGFPDAAVEINELAVEGDVAFCWWTLRGTHDGPFRGIEPTGNAVEVDGFSFRRVRDGRVVEAKDVASMVGLLKQVGVDAFATVPE